MAVEAVNWVEEALSLAEPRHVVMDVGILPAETLDEGTLDHVRKVS